MTPEELAKLQELQQKYNAMAGTAPQAPGTWGHKPTLSSSPIAGIAVPIKVPYNGGSVRCYVSLPPEATASEEALLAALEAMERMGMELDIWSRRGGGWGGGQDNTRRRDWRR